MTPTPINTNRELVNSLWKQNIRNAKEISKKTGIHLRSCERYVHFLRKNLPFIELVAPQKYRLNNVVKLE